MANESVFPPLDQIRQVEAEVARKVFLASEAANKSIVECRQQASQILKNARIGGEHEGRVRYKSILAKGEEEATELVAEAKLQASNLRQQRKIHMDSQVSKIVKFITGMETDL